MSDLAQRKTKLVFTTCEAVRERGKSREVIIQAEPYFALVRLKGTRTAFPIRWETIYQKAAAIHAARVKQDRLDAKKAAKKQAKR